MPREPDSTLVDRVKVYVISSGTGAFTLGDAVRAYRGVEALRDGETYSYAVENGAQYEVGRGEYVASLTSLTRNPTASSNGGAVVDFPTNSELAFTALASDLSVVSAYVDAALAVGFETWAGLQNFASQMADGDETFVSDSDTGTHTDPASGLTVDNAGVYVKQTGYTNPVRLRDTAAQDAQDIVDTVPAVMQPFINEANAAATEAKNVIFAPASYGVPLGDTVGAGTTTQGAAATYRYQTPVKYDFTGDTFEIYNAGADGLQVRLRMFDATGSQVATGAGYSGEKLLTLTAGYNSFDISDFFGSAGQYWGLYAQINALSADTTKRSTMGGYWSRTGNQTTGVTTVSNAGVLHMFRFNVTEKVMSGAEYAESLRSAPAAVSTSYGAEIEHVWDGSSLNAGNHGETPPALLLADFYGIDRDAVRNVAVGGRTVAQMLNAAATELYPALDAAFATGRIVVLHVDSGVIYNTVNNASGSSAATAAADINTAFAALIAGLTTWKTAYPSLVIDLSDLPNVLGSSHWTPEHYTAFQATFQATAMGSGVVDYTTRISTVPETQDSTNTTYFNPDQVHPMTALNELYVPVFVASLNAYYWGLIANQSVAIAAAVVAGVAQIDAAGEGVLDQAEALIGAAETALQPGAPISQLSETASAKIMTAAERTRLQGASDSSRARYHNGKLIESATVDSGLGAVFVRYSDFSTLDLRGVTTLKAKKLDLGGVITDASRVYYHNGKQIISATVDQGLGAFNASYSDGSNLTAPVSSLTIGDVKTVSSRKYFHAGKAVATAIVDAGGGVISASYQDGSRSPIPQNGPIAVYGHSMAAGTGATVGTDDFCTRLAIRTGRYVYNFGIGSQTSTQIAGRQGGFVPKLTFPGNTISAGANTVTAINGSPVVGIYDSNGVSTYPAWQYQIFTNVPSTNTRSARGVVAGVPGVFRRTASGSGASETETYDFTPDAVLPTGLTLPIKCTSSEPIVLENDLYAQMTQVWWTAANNSSEQTKIASDLASMVKYMPHERYVIMGDVTGTGQGSGTQKYTYVTSGNADTQALYPRQFVDVRRELINRGLALAGLTATTDDTSDIASDTIPRSLLYDGFHQNAACQDVLALLIADNIKKRNI